MCQIEPSYFGNIEIAITANWLQNNFTGAVVHPYGRTCFLVEVKEMLVFGRTNTVFVQHHLSPNQTALAFLTAWANKLHFLMKKAFVVTVNILTSSYQIRSKVSTAMRYVS